MARFTGRNLTCIRGERRVFMDLDFAIKPGGALKLVGPNGSGKSSLLRLMAGLIPPASGTLAWDDGAVSEDPEEHNARLHYVGHLDSVKTVLTVAENVRFWAGLRPGADTSRAAIATALGVFGIAHLIDVPGRFLSAGQKRRVNLTRIVSAPVELWLLDEPTTALDAAATASLEQTMARHRADGGMVVVSTHTEMGLDDAEVLDLSGFSENARGVAEAMAGDL